MHYFRMFGGAARLVVHRGVLRQMTMLSWSEVSKRAGPMKPRRFEENPRLFGSDKEPKLVFWRDNSAWCPYCLRLWLILEAMEVSYVMKTIPLAAYLKKNERKPAEFLNKVPSGVVPALEFLPDRTNAVEGVQHLIGVLEEKWPSKFPRPTQFPECYDAVVRDGGVRDAFECARRAYETCAGAPARGYLGDPETYFEMTGLLGACRALNAVLERSGGPFVCGKSPTAADWQIIPLLERAEVVPLYFWGTNFEVFKGLTDLLEAARSETFFQFYASDATTLARTNVRYAPQGFLPRDPVVAATIDANPAWLQSATPEAALIAAQRLAANHDAVAAFSIRTAQINLSPEENLQGAVDLALRAVASALLRRSDQQDFSSRDHQRQGLLDDLLRGVERKKKPAAKALRALALSVGVPRDMDLDPANALRAYANLAADLLQDDL